MGHGPVVKRETAVIHNTEPVFSFMLLRSGHISVPFIDPEGVLCVDEIGLEHALVLFRLVKDVFVKAFELFGVKS